MAQVTERTYAAEWLKWMVDRGYCLAVGTIPANGAAVAGIVSGQMMQGAIGARIVCAAGPATAILVEPATLAEHIAGCKKLMLERGPAIIDSDLCQVTDPSDLTDLQTLGIFAINSGLVTWSTQTT